MEKTQVMVIGVKNYSFADRETGELRQGTTVHYYDIAEANEEGLKGYVPAKANLPYEAYKDFKQDQIPAVYEPDISYTLRGNKPTLKVNGFKFLRKAN